jgi:hypothetical protein
MKVHLALNHFIACRVHVVLSLRAELCEDFVDGTFVGVDWSWLAMDGAITKAPLGGGKIQRLRPPDDRAGPFSGPSATRLALVRFVVRGGDRVARIRKR